MSWRIPQIPSDGKLSQRISIPLLQEIYPRDVIGELLSSLGRWEQRERKLSQLLMTYLLIAWHLFLQESLRSVFLHLSAQLRLLGLLSSEAVPTKNAFINRRKQLGVRLLRLLMRRVCKPQATQETPHAFAFGLRLVAVDGTVEDVADSCGNARFFGRMCEGQTASPYPQARCVYLLEVATHIIFDAIVAPCRASEAKLCWGLLRSLGSGMLVLLDRGFVGAAFFEAIVARQAQVLARLPRGIFLRREKELSDGSYLTTLRPAQCACLKAPLLVRVIEYHIEPRVAESLAGQPQSRMASHSQSTKSDVKKLHRLVTTLLDPQTAPAMELCLIYHERWEIELTIDETKNHLRISRSPLRSHLPLLALQELYALLLTHYAIRVVMFRASQLQPGLDPDRVSFTVCIQALRDVAILGSGLLAGEWETIIGNLCLSLVEKASLVEPRRLRFNCRVVKRICTRFRCKRPEHRNLTLPGKVFSDLILLSPPVISLLALGPPALLVPAHLPVPLLPSPG